MSKTTKTDVARLAGYLSKSLGLPEDPTERGALFVRSWSYYGRTMNVLAVRNGAGASYKDLPFGQTAQPTGEFYESLGMTLNFLEYANRPVQIEETAGDYNGWNSWESWYVNSVLENDSALVDKRDALRARINGGEFPEMSVAKTRAIANLYNEALAATNKMQRDAAELPIYLSGADWIDLADYFMRECETARLWDTEQAAAVAVAS